MQQPSPQRPLVKLMQAAKAWKRPSSGYLGLQTPTKQSNRFVSVLRRLIGYTTSGVPVLRASQMVVRRPARRAEPQLHRQEGQTLTRSRLGLRGSGLDLARSWSGSFGTVRRCVTDELIDIPDTLAGKHTLPR
jgi:hypothetical protein